MDGLSGTGPQETRTEYSKPYSYLLQHHLKLIQDSGIDPAISAARGYRSETTKSHIKALGFGQAQCNVPALLVPLWNVRGEPAGYQSRPDAPRVKGEKQLKYETPAGMRMVLDVHPSLSQPRTIDQGDYDPPKQIEPLIADPAIPLFVTEGVRKADAAVSIELCCIALLGVWNWRGSNSVGGTTALPDWENIALKGRQVYIAFDSDVMTKLDVHKAITRLKTWLESRGAAVSIIYLTPGENGTKVGLDDWVAARRRMGQDDAATRAELLGLAADELRAHQVEKGAKDRPDVVVFGGELHHIVDRCQEVLASEHRKLQVYERGGLLVRPLIHAADDINKKATAIRRQAGTVTLKALTVPGVRDVLTRAVSFQKPLKPGRDHPERIDCTKLVAEVVLSRAGDGSMPELVGIIEAPCLRPDGTLLSEPGYDEATGLYLHSDRRWLQVPERPTLEDAKSALQVLLKPFSQFPFETEGDRSVVIAAILTTLQRRLLFSAPLFGADAPTQGSGKSLLIGCVSSIATGHAPTCVSAPTDDRGVAQVANDRAARGRRDHLHR